MKEETKQENLFAFPGEYFNEEEGERIESPGMTLRDYFAAKAMQGICSDPEKYAGEYNWIEHNAEYAYKIADAMLKARETNN